MSQFQLTQVEGIWKNFWGNKESGDDDSNQHNGLQREKLLLLCQMKAVQEFVKEVDYIVYQKLVTILLPEILRNIPSTLI